MICIFKRVKVMIVMYKVTYALVKVTMIMITMIVNITLIMSDIMIRITIIGIKLLQFCENVRESGDFPAKSRGTFVPPA